MYLSQLQLNLRDPEVARDLANCQDLHCRLLAAFPSGIAEQQSGARAQSSFLFRVGDANAAAAVSVLAQSTVAPAWDRLPYGYARSCECKEVSAALDCIVPGSRFRFRLRANPTRRVHRRAAQGSDEHTGRRSPEHARAVGRRVALRDEADQLPWLTRHGEAAGFALVNARLEPGGEEFSTVTVRPAGILRGWKGRSVVTVETALFEGVLETTDAALFRQSIANGIGPGKAYGCGLLSLAPLRR